MATKVSRKGNRASQGIRPSVSPGHALLAGRMGVETRSRAWRAQGRLEFLHNLHSDSEMVALPQGVAFPEAGSRPWATHSGPILITQGTDV